VTLRAVRIERVGGGSVVGERRGGAEPGAAPDPAGCGFFEAFRAVPSASGVPGRAGELGSFGPGEWLCLSLSGGYGRCGDSAVSGVGLLAVVLWAAGIEPVCVGCVVGETLGIAEPGAAPDPAACGFFKAHCANPSACGVVAGRVSLGRSAGRHESVARFDPATEGRDRFSTQRCNDATALPVRARHQHGGPNDDC
jgi:hypothetical protein